MKMDKSNSKIFQYGEVLHTYGTSLSIDINATDIQNGAGFQSTPSVWRVTEAKTLELYLYGISIHTLRVEGDHAYPLR